MEPRTYKPCDFYFTVRTELRSSCHQNIQHGLTGLWRTKDSERGWRFPKRFPNACVTCCRSSIPRTSHADVVLMMRASYARTLHQHPINQSPLVLPAAHWFFAHISSCNRYWWIDDVVLLSNGVSSAMICL
jgi:hypothetical protein